MKFRNSWFVVFVLFAFVLAACGGGGSPDPGTTSQPPIVSAAAATGVTVDSATLNGSVNPNGNATTVWFEWGTSPTLASYSSTPSQSVGSGVASVAVTANLTGLSQSTTYYYRLCGNSSADQVKSSIVSFTTGTPAAPPTVQTWAPSGVTTTAATLNGGVNPNGNATTVWFEWGTSPTLASYTATANQPIGSGVTSVAITANLTGLASSTAYYYRACGMSSAGTIRGSITSVITQTPGIPPTVQTLGATGITTTTATLNANVNPNSLATLAFFEWGTSPTLATFTTTTAQSIGSGASAVPVSENLTGLASNTTYYYRVGATNAAGGNIDVIASFTTHVLTGLAPAIISTTVISTGTDNIVVQAVVDPRDTTAPADVVLAGTVDNLTWVSTAHQMVNPGASQTLTFVLTGLTPDALYSLRTTASNTWGSDVKLDSARTQAVSGTGTLIVYIYALDNVIILADNAVVIEKNVTSANYYPVTVPAGARINIIYKFRGDGFRPYVGTDLAGNNEFIVAAGKDMTWFANGTNANGEFSAQVSGSGFTTSRVAPGNFGGSPDWNIIQTVTMSTNNNIDNGAVVTETRTMTQTGSRLTYPTSIGTIYGVAIGNRAYFYFEGGADPSWYIYWKEWAQINAAGTSLSGTNEEIWKARSGTDVFFVQGNEVGTR